MERNNFFFWSSVEDCLIGQCYVYILFWPNKDTHTLDEQFFFRSIHYAIEKWKRKKKLHTKVKQKSHCAIDTIKYKNCYIQVQVCCDMHTPLDRPPRFKCNANTASNGWIVKTFISFVFLSLLSSWYCKSKCCNLVSVPFVRFYLLLFHSGVFCFVYRFVSFRFKN